MERPSPWCCVMDDLDLASYKKVQRVTLLAARQELPDRVNLVNSLQQALRIWLITRTDTCIAGYWPIRGEFDPLPALHRWQEAGLATRPEITRKIALPVSDKATTTLKFHAWFPGCPMQHDAFDIPKPLDTEQLQPSLVLVPCVGYGPGGVRLGYGGGFFDRTLAQLEPRPATIGLCFSHAYLPKLVAEAHDIPLDAILTEQGLVWQKS
jgi:5-formyltetrahydrofolate cyclo-ligase